MGCETLVVTNSAERSFNKIMHFVIANIVKQSVSLRAKAFKLNYANLQYPRTHITSETLFVILGRRNASLNLRPDTLSFLLTY
jgi:hypothetical protein